MYFVLMQRYEKDTLIDEEYFIIDKPNIKKGNTIEKDVHCYSSHYTILNKRILRSYSDVKPLYKQDEPNNSSAGLLNYMVSQIYNAYTIGYVHSDFLNLTRSWNYTSNTYGDVFKDIMSQIDCVIKIDTLNDVINI